MSFIKEFREFAMRGNVVDMAVGVIIGGAFGKIVSSLVADVFMPVLGILTGGVDFKDLKITLADAVGETPAVTLNYGVFIQNVFDFIIIAFAIFMMIKALMSWIPAIGALLGALCLFFYPLTTKKMNEIQNKLS